MNKNINYDRLIEQVGKCCLTEDFCGTCQKEACLIGYCKHVLLKAFKQHNEFIDGGMDNIPSFDTKLYKVQSLKGWSNKTSTAKPAKWACTWPWQGWPKGRVILR